MSDLGKLEQKIDKSHEKIDKLVETMTTFIAFQARAEERHTSTSERLSKLETQMTKLWDMVHKNSIIVNGALGLGGILIGAVATVFLGG